MMFSNYKSITNDKNGQKTDMQDQISKKQCLFFGLTCLIIGVIVGVALQSASIFNNSNNKLTPSHSLLQGTETTQTSDAKSQFEDFDFRSDTEISSFAGSYSWTVTAKLEDLSTNDIVTITSGHSRGLLNNPSGTNKVRTTPTYNSNRNLWKVGVNGNQYTFRNLQDNCYLQARDGVLKCTSTLDNKGKWKRYGLYLKDPTDDSDHKRFASVLQNVANDKCANVGGTSDSSIDLHKNHCGHLHSLFQFEIVD